MKVFFALAFLLASTVSIPAAEKTEKPTPPKADSKPAFKNLTVEEFEKLRKEKNTVVLDVRTAAEFKQGHVPGAVNIDVNAPDFAEKTQKLDPSKTYLVHCAGGRRGATACGKLAGKFDKLYNLEN